MINAFRIMLMAIGFALLFAADYPAAVCWIAAAVFLAAFILNVWSIAKEETP